MTLTLHARLHVPSSERLPLIISSEIGTSFAKNNQFWGAEDGVPDKGGKTAMLGDGYLGGGGPVIDPFSVTFYMLDISHHKRFYSFIYGCTRSSLLHVGRGNSLLAVGRLLIAVVSHVVEHGL